jgi:flagellar hook-length control protein FliK
MNHVSTIPAPVAACASGFGSFFGACQMAAGNFDAILQTARGSAKFGATGQSEQGGQTDLLAYLQKALGEEAGTEAFALLADLAENGSEILSQASPKDQAIIRLLQKNPKFLTEAPPDMQKNVLENCFESIKSIIASMHAEPQAEQIAQTAQIAGKIASEIENAEQPKEAKDILDSLSAEDRKNIRILSWEMGISVKDISKFEGMMVSLLESGLITSQDLEDAVKVTAQELPNGWQVVSMEDFENAKDLESSPIRNVLEDLWKIVKNENELDEEELPQEFEKLAKLHFLANRISSKPAHGYGNQPDIHIIKVPGAKAKLFDAVRIKDPDSGEIFIQRARGRIDFNKQSSIGMEIDVKTGEFSVWTQVPNTQITIPFVHGNVNDAENVIDAEEAPVEALLSSVLKVLYEKYRKHAKKEDGEEEDKEIEAAKEAVAKDKNLQDAFFGEENIKEIAERDPVLYNALSLHAELANIASQNANFNAEEQIALSQDSETDKLLGNFFLLLKKVKNNGVLTKEEAATINAFLENRLDIKQLQKFAAKEEPELAEKVENLNKQSKAQNASDMQMQHQPPRQPKESQSDIQPQQQLPPQAQLQQLSQTQPKQPKQTPVAQPEIRAVWEGSDLKIEAFNPKTGEKIQTVSTRMPSAMQDRIHEFEVVKQVVAQAKLITTPTGEQRMTIHLRPDQLGQVDLRITLNHGEMQIQARVESAVAQSALESHIGLLREGLEKHGISLDRLEVSVEQRDKQDAFSMAERQDREEQRQHRQKSRRGREQHLAVSITKDQKSDTGRRHGYNTMEYLA